MFFKFLGRGPHFPAVALFASLLFCAGCASEPKTPWGDGPQADPRREINRLGYLRGKQKDPDKQYAIDLRLIELHEVVEKDNPYSHYYASWNKYQQLIHEFPDRPEAPMRAAKRVIDHHAKIGRWSREQPYAREASAWIDRLIARNPNNGEYHLIRAQLGRAGGEPYLDAHLSRAAKLIPNDPRLKLEMAENAVDTWRMKEAMPLLAAAEKALPNSADVHYLLGRVASSAGDIKRATYQYDKALGINPNHVDALAARTILMYTEKDANAKANIDKLLKLSEGHPASLMFRGLQFWDQNRHGEAIEHLRGAMLTDPNNGLYRHVRERMIKSRDDAFYRGVAITAAAGLVVGAMALNVSDDAPVKKNAGLAEKDLCRTCKGTGIQPRYPGERLLNPMVIYDCSGCGGDGRRH